MGQRVQQLSGSALRGEGVYVWLMSWAVSRVSDPSLRSALIFKMNYLLTNNRSSLHNSALISSFCTIHIFFLWIIARQGSLWRVHGWGLWVLTSWFPNNKNHWYDFNFVRFNNVMNLSSNLLMFLFLVWFSNHDYHDSRFLFAFNIKAVDIFWQDVMPWFIL